LPPYVEREDFISGTMNWRGQSFRVYFEHSLGYLEFAAHNRESLEQVVNIALRSDDA